MQGAELQSPTEAPWAWTATTLVLAFALSSLSIVFVTYPPVQDYPNHVLRIHVLESLERVETYASHVEVDAGFRPNMMMDLWMGLLVRVLPLQAAGKTVLLGQLALAAVALFIYIRVFGGGVLAALVGMHLAAGWIFLKGLTNFHFGVSFALIYLAVLWRNGERLRPRDGVAATLLALGVVASHGFVLLAVSAIVGFTALFEIRRLPRVALARACTLLPALVAFSAFFLRAMSTSDLANNVPVFGTSLKGLLRWYPELVWTRFHPALDVATGWFAYGLMAVGAIALGLRIYRRSHVGQARYAMLFVLAAAMLYIFLPLRLTGGWGHMKFRMLYIGVLAAVPLVAGIRHRGLAWVGTAVMAGFLTAVAAMGFLHARTFSEQAAEFVQLGETLPRGSVVLPLDLTGEAAVRANLHLWSYICMERDCLSPALFIRRYIQNAYFKTEFEDVGWLDYTGIDWDEVGDVLEGCNTYDAVLLFGRSPDAEDLILKDMRPLQVAEVGGVYGCR